VRRNRTEEAVYGLVADELGLSISDVRLAVSSFFGEIVSESRALPFNNERKIYSKEKFAEYERAWNIPYIGRIGPVYSRYLKWRGNESKNIVQEPRSNYQSRITQSDIEDMAEAILSGRTPTPLRKRKGNELYNRVWLVGQDGKKLARQVIPKTKEDGI